MNWPGRPPRSSTARRTWFHVAGTQLPLVDQARLVTVEKQGGIEEARRTRLVIDVEADRARRHLQAGRRLAAAARTLDQDGTDRGEAVRELGVRDPRAVLEGWSTICRARGTHLCRS